MKLLGGKCDQLAALLFSRRWNVAYTHSVSPVLLLASAHLKTAFSVPLTTTEWFNITVNPPLPFSIRHGSNNALMCFNRLSPERVGKEFSYRSYLNAIVMWNFQAVGGPFCTKRVGTISSKFLSYVPEMNNEQQVAYWQGNPIVWNREGCEVFFRSLCYATDENSWPHRLQMRKGY